MQSNAATIEHSEVEAPISTAKVLGGLCKYPAKSPTRW
jgi:hypothetical protein